VARTVTTDVCGSKLFAQDVAVARVASELLDHEQVDPPDADRADARVLFVSFRSYCPAINRDRSLARSNSAMTSTRVSFSPTAKLPVSPDGVCRRGLEEALEPDPFGGGGMLDQRDRRGQRRH